MMEYAAFALGVTAIAVLALHVSWLRRRRKPLLDYRRFLMEAFEHVWSESHTGQFAAYMEFAPCAAERFEALANDVCKANGFLDDNLKARVKAYADAIRAYR